MLNILVWLFELAYNYIDKNNDGVLSKDELKDLKKTYDDVVDKIKEYKKGKK